MKVIGVEGIKGEEQGEEGDEGTGRKLSEEDEVDRERKYVEEFEGQ